MVTTGLVTAGDSLRSVECHRLEHEVRQAAEALGLSIARLNIESVVRPGGSSGVRISVCATRRTTRRIGWTLGLMIGTRTETIEAEVIAVSTPIGHYFVVVRNGEEQHTTMLDTAIAEAFE